MAKGKGGQRPGGEHPGGEKPKRSRAAAAPKPSAPAPAEPVKEAEVAAAAEPAKAAESKKREEFSIALATPGADIPDGGRRFGCPDCGAKHDIVRADAVSGQGGTWSVPDFKCLAPCGYAAVSQPVT